MKRLFLILFPFLFLKGDIHINTQVNGFDLMDENLLVEKNGSVVGNNHLDGITIKEIYTSQLENKGKIEGNLTQQGSGIRLEELNNGIIWNKGTIIGYGGIVLEKDNGGKILNDGNLTGIKKMGIKGYHNLSLIENNGTIEGKEGGIWIANNLFKITNNGKIKTGQNGDGITVSRDNNGTIENRGKIESGRDGIIIWNSNDKVENFGAIDANNTGIAISYNHSVLQNDGNITSKVGIEIKDENGKKVINNGKIVATVRGINLFAQTDTGSVENRREIRIGQGGIGIEVGENNGSIANQGTIGGNGKTGISVAKNRSQIQNYGTIGTQIGISTIENRGTIANYNKITGKNGIETFFNYGTVENRGTIIATDTAFWIGTNAGEGVNWGEAEGAYLFKGIGGKFINRGKGKGTIETKYSKIVNSGELELSATQSITGSRFIQQNGGILKVETTVFQQGKEFLTQLSHIQTDEELTFEKNSKIEVNFNSNLDRSTLYRWFYSLKPASKKWYRILKGEKGPFATSKNGKIVDNGVEVIGNSKLFQFEKEQNGKNLDLIVGLKEYQKGYETLVTTYCCQSSREVGRALDQIYHLPVISQSFVDLQIELTKLPEGTKARAVAELTPIPPVAVGELSLLTAQSVGKIVTYHQFTFPLVKWSQKKGVGGVQLSFSHANSSHANSFQPNSSHANSSKFTAKSATSQPQDPWIQPFFTKIKQKDREGYLGYRGFTKGFVIGFDNGKRMGKVGIGIGYSRSNLKVNCLPQTAKVDTYWLIGYTTLPVYWNGWEVGINGGVGMGKVSTRRELSLVEKTATARFNTQTYFLQTTFKRNSFNANSLFYLSPTFSFSYRYFHIPSYREEGAGDYGVEVYSHIFRQLVVGIGGNGGYQFTPTNRLFFTVGIDYNLLHRRNGITSDFLGEKGIQFQTEGIRPSPTSYYSNIGILHQFFKNGNFSVGVALSNSPSGFSAYSLYSQLSIGF